MGLHDGGWGLEFLVEQMSCYREKSPSKSAWTSSSIA